MYGFLCKMKRVLVSNSSQAGMKSRQIISDVGCEE